MNIGIAIKKVRMERGLTQKELSALLRISPTSMCQIEKGTKRPSRSNLSKICEVLNVPEIVIYVNSIEIEDVSEDKRERFKDIFPTLQVLVKVIY